MDVHPPLAKLLLTLAGWLAGFDGEFDFKDIGKDYVEPGVPYVAMRLLPAIMGVLTIPTMFLTLKAAGCKTTTAALGAGLIIFGAAPAETLIKTWLTQSQKTALLLNLVSSSSIRLSLFSQLSPRFPGPPLPTSTSRAPPKPSSRRGGSGSPPRVLV